MNIKVKIKEYIKLLRIGYEPLLLFIYDGWIKAQIKKFSYVAELIYVLQSHL